MLVTSGLFKICMIFKTYLVVLNNLNCHGSIDEMYALEIIYSFYIDKAIYRQAKGKMAQLT